MISRSKSLEHAYQSRANPLCGLATQCVAPLLSACFLLTALPQNAYGQISFEELKQSEAYFKLENRPSAGQRVAPGKSNRREFFTNYDSLWASKRSAQLLLQWIEIRVPNHQLEPGITGMREDHLVAETRLRNRQMVDVLVTIQIPKPQYKAMAELKTLVSFNRFRPPALDVVGSQKVEIQGTQADYYRISDGSCSLLIQTEQMGIVNLSVSRCPNSGAMFDVAKRLNFTRLNQKLTS